MSILPFFDTNDMKGFSLGIQYYISRRHWIDAMTPLLYRQGEELVDKILLMLNRDIVISKNNLFSIAKISILFNIQNFSRKIYILGREKLLKDIFCF